jgi:hypothetical protein
MSKVSVNLTGSLKYRRHIRVEWNSCCLGLTAQAMEVLRMLKCISPAYAHNRDRLSHVTSSRLEFAGASLYCERSV